VDGIYDNNFWPAGILVRGYLLENKAGLWIAYL